MPRKLLPLVGLVSEGTALVVDDYPYGFTLRCKIRYWIEFSPKHGYRFVSQTTNPKRPGEVWNKPKKSTYSAMMVMVRVDDPEADDHGHVKYTSLYAGAGSEKIAEFAEKWKEALEENQLAELRMMGKMSKKVEEMYARGDIKHEITRGEPILVADLIK